MRQEYFNEDNLRENEITKISKKVRGIITNSNEEILLARCADFFMFPGGTMEEGEDEHTALKREILEETGMSINPEQSKIFLKTYSYDKNYLDRRDGLLNRKTETTFFLISNPKKINLKHRSLTDDEKVGNFQLKFIKPQMIKDLLKKTPVKNPKRKQFDRDILIVLEELQKMQENQKGFDR